MTAWTPGPGVVELPDGRRVRGRALRDGPATGEDPDLGVHLLTRPPPRDAWPVRWVRWPDLSVPWSTADAVDALLEAHRHAGDGRVEVVCRGGRGRTGSALALMAVMSGVPPGDAVAWVRRHYRSGAVETPWQRRWVRRTGGRIGAADGRSR